MQHTYCQHSISQNFAVFQQVTTLTFWTTCQSQMVQDYNRFHIALFPLSFCRHFVWNKYWPMAIYEDGMYLQIVCWHSLVSIRSSIKSEYPVQWKERSLTNECPNHNIVYNVKSSWIKISRTRSFGLQWRTDGTNESNLVCQAKKESRQISSTMRT